MKNTTSTPIDALCEQLTNKANTLEAEYHMCINSLLASEGSAFRVEYSTDNSIFIALFSGCNTILGTELNIRLGGLRSWERERGGEKVLLVNDGSTGCFDMEDRDPESRAYFIIEFGKLLSNQVLLASLKKAMEIYYSERNAIDLEFYALKRRGI